MEKEDKDNKIIKKGISETEHKKIAKVCLSVFKEILELVIIVFVLDFLEVITLTDKARFSLILTLAGALSVLTFFRVCSKYLKKSDELRKLKKKLKKNKNHWLSKISFVKE